jgi:hypothetical protein
VPVAKKVASKEFETLKSAVPLTVSSNPVLACACTIARSFAFSTRTFAIAEPAELEKEPTGVVTDAAPPQNRAAASAAVKMNLFMIASRRHRNIALQGHQHPGGGAELRRHCDIDV